MRNFVQLLFTKYWVFAHLMVLAGTLFFLPNTAMKLNATIWCCFSSWLFAYLLPVVLRGETFLLARIRWIDSIIHHVITYMGVLLLLFILCRYYNSGRDFVFNDDILRWEYAKALYPGLPSSITPQAGVSFICALLGGLTCVLLSDSLFTRRLKFYLVQSFLAWGAIGAVIAFILMQLHPESTTGWHFICENSFYAGILHLLLLSVALGCMIGSYLEIRPKRYYWSASCALLNLFGALLSTSLMVWIIAAILTLVGLITFLLAVARSKQLKGSLHIIGAIVGVIFAWIYFFTLINTKEMTLPIFTSTYWATQFSQFIEVWVFRNNIALQIWENAPTYGVGFDGVSQVARFHLVSQADWDLFYAPILGSTDHVRFLSEHGILGMFLLYLPVLFLLWRILLKWVTILQDPLHNAYSYRFIFVFWGTLLGLIIVFLASFVDTPLHDPTVYYVSFCLFGCLPNWLPRAR